jgi:hypothetical protein
MEASPFGFLGGLVPRRARARSLPDITASLGLLDATVFLYPTADDAEKGTGFGGSGVIVGVPLTIRPDLCIRYAVTNWHVAVTGGHSVIRMSLPDGSSYVADRDSSEWTFIPNGPDLAAIPLTLPNDVQPGWVSIRGFIDGEPGSDVHVGDDVFMVGRFIDYDGHETNRPATRFGAISMMDAPHTAANRLSRAVDHRGYAQSNRIFRQPRIRISDRRNAQDRCVARGHHRDGSGWTAGELHAASLGVRD